MNFVSQLTRSKHFKTVIIVGFFAISALAWFLVKVYGHYYISTDNAYINANVVQIAPRVTGKVIHVAVKNNQYVNKGDPLFDIDAEPFEIAIESAKAQILISEAQLEKARNFSKRTEPLVEHKYLPLQEGDNVTAQLKTAMGQLAYAKAALTQANLNLSYTRITAPTSGWVTNASLRVGDVVMANQSLFALISDEEFWADANFKETEMSEIKPGQKATIVTDLYPHHEFEGVVESISGGAGTAFSLLPPQNATGNWVKVTQRIPARVHILNPDAKNQLRVGISATVTIKLREETK